jgi:uncharacterized membrane protein
VEHIGYDRGGQQMQTLTATAQRRARVESIDVLRGVVMILMALDHVRDFFGAAGNPTDPVHTTVPLFFTRWITHVCAPVFFLLTGTSAYLSQRRRSMGQLSRFLFTRGLWLIVLELTVLRCFGYQFNVDYRVTMLIILWALGWSMMTLAVLVHLPVPVVTAFGVALIGSHNLLDSVNASSFGAFAPVWSALHAPNVIVATPRHVVFAAYPLIPWVGVTAAGYGLGQVFSWAPERRRDFFLRLGIGLAMAFVALRYANVYGDPLRWTAQQSVVRTVLSFLNTNKYPPSLLYLLMTLGPASLLLWMADRATAPVFRPALVFGKVPLFYFLLHLPLIHLLATAVCYVRYGDTHWMFESARLDQFPVTRPPGWGYSLPIVYLIWACVVIGLYPLCLWFAKLKQRRTDTWLSYL